MVDDFMCSCNVLLSLLHFSSIVDEDFERYV